MIIRQVMQITRQSHLIFARSCKRCAQAIIMQCFMTPCKLVASYLALTSLKLRNMSYSTLMEWKNPVLGSGMSTESSALIIQTDNDP